MSTRLRRSPIKTFWKNYRNDRKQQFFAIKPEPQIEIKIEPPIEIKLEPLIEVVEFSPFTDESETFTG